MITRLVLMLGVVHAVVIAVTLLALIIALNEMGAAPEVTGGVTLLTGAAIVLAPFGAKYRRW